MRASLQQWIYRIQGSYWFIPSLMVLTAIMLSQFTIWLDRTVGSEWLQDFWFSSMNQPDGARALLATVAGSMITVAGVTFSLTILAVSHATSHFGPRLLDNFMRDRGNQVTLGTFVATFLYCLLVLKVVRGGSVPEDASDAVEAFVPQLSLLIGLVLTILSVAELIYFIHHVPDSIHISTVLRRLATDMSAKFDELYPETLGEGMSDVDSVPTLINDFLHTVRSDVAGYLQGVDEDELMSFAKKHDVVVRLKKRPGDFVRRDELIAEVSRCETWSDERAGEVRHGFAFGYTRTPTQDVFFILDEFVEVATRALSPGVNDPFTAMQCMDWLSDGLVQLSQRKIPTRFRIDEQDELRIITTDVTREDFVEAMLRQLLPYVKEDRNASQYFVQSMQQVLEISKSQTLNSLIEDAVAELENARNGECER
ncbi:DUF2254 domain-containing protein [Rhodopirellula sp. JC740]|uniref:DUF2254 domain-containing protein n=1 Tax=Rhodopirellula halodulae TaxID=2894198 RepID=A0ABS8NF27_9BACT|nr:DUF2254 domain-containing protein [Rhodopirellula sp. JC740]MCC9642024.1 DUF2254 domain-containing protein [Rhodopirellula sp. JC740]